MKYDLLECLSCHTEAQSNNCVQKYDLGMTWTFKIKTTSTIGHLLWLNSFCLTFCNPITRLMENLRKNSNLTNSLRGLWNPEVQCRNHNGSPIIPILSRINTITRIVTFFYLRSTLILSSHLRLGLPKEDLKLKITKYEYLIRNKENMKSDLSMELNKISSNWGIHTWTKAHHTRKWKY